MSCPKQWGVPEGHIDVRIPILSLEVGSMTRPDIGAQVPTIRVVFPPYYIEGPYTVERVTTISFTTEQRSKDRVDYHIVLGDGIMRFGFHLEHAQHVSLSTNVRNAGCWGLILEGSLMTCFVIRNVDSMVLSAEAGPSNRFAEVVRQVEENIERAAARGMAENGGRQAPSTGKIRYN